MPYTVVSFHAHPDDEALYTAGTLAQAVADGHRVVLVVATAGETGLAAATGPDEPPLGERRVEELRASAAEIGCARLVLLGYGDSGFAGTAQSPGRQPFATIDVEEAAARLAEILVVENADLLTTYDPAGGYGHADHKQVHRVGARAAELAGTPVVLQATADRDILLRVVWLLRRLRWVLPLSIPQAETAYTPRGEITHRVDITRQLAVKRAAIAAHVSQSTAPSGVRTLALILKLPRPVFARVFRYEWYVEQGRRPQTPPLGDIFTTLHP